MYGLPEGFNAARLMGRTLQLLCFSENQLFLHFDEMVSIEVEGEISYEDLCGNGPELLQVPMLESDLMKLLGRSIVKASANKQGILTLEFDNGHILSCLDTPEYESYKIRFNDEEIIV
jgi:Family of unknown function (DUF6188)